MNVVQDSWNFVSFRKNPDAVIESGVSGSGGRFTLCSGLVFYNRAAECCAVSHYTSSPNAHKGFWEWLKGGIDPGSTLLVIKSYLASTPMSRYFTSAIDHVTAQSDSRVIKCREGVGTGERTISAGIRCNSTGWTLYKGGVAEDPIRW